MAASRQDDELAQTATAPGSSHATASAAALAPGATLARYRLESALGEGGMGVVYAAFDPDLERRVAVKVLRTAEDAGDEARQRLLREARAMARLTHPNVVTVHEVGTANRRDYVAMELIEGETLADWLRVAKRTVDEIVSAFVAAGRGLAAAHAAGLVHRDFKPHNVLRRRDGRICVTDFGLARGVEAAAAVDRTALPCGSAEDGAQVPAFAASLQLGKGGAAIASTPGRLSGLTATGSVLGTPAYMAPEQWRGGTVGPPADQFAFCVALWEALAGERPFRGATLEDLKADVQRGPAAVDDSKLPRRLRAVLRRGLDPDPARRWPSMDTLLHALARRDRRRLFALTAASGAIVAAAIAFVALRGEHTATGCEPPAREIEDVWSPQMAAVLAAAGRGEVRDAIDRDVASWRVERAQACTARSEQRAARLACLDGVLARIDALHRALDRMPAKAAVDGVLGHLVDPKVCAAAVPPRLTVAATPDTIEAFALAIHATSAHDSKLARSDAAAAFATRSGVEPCARGYARLAEVAMTDDIPRGKAAIADALTAVESCGDDRLRADVLIEQAPLEYEVPVIGPKGRAALEKAKAAVDRVAQPDLVARIDYELADLLSDDHRWEEAFAAIRRAIAGYGARGRVLQQLGAVKHENMVRLARGEVADLAEMLKVIEHWKPIAKQGHFKTALAGLEISEAYAKLFLGDVEGAHAEMLRLYKPQTHPDVPTERIEGTVVDEAGKPMAGAIVAAARTLFVDSVGPSVFGQARNELRMVTTDKDGKFMIPDAPVRGALAAQLELRRGYAELAAHSTIVLHDTRRLSGKVELGKVPRTKVFVMVVLTGRQARPVLFMSPLSPDGTFLLQGVPKGDLSVAVTIWGTAFSSQVEFHPIPAGGDVRDRNLRVPAGNGRSFDVIARSAVTTTLDGAQVIVVPGKHRFLSANELYAQHGDPSGHFLMSFARPLVGAAIPAAARPLARPGDLFLHVDDVSAGDLTACVVGLNGDLSDTLLWEKIAAHQKELEFKCEVAGPDDQVVVVEAPPQKRID
jgi:hypothetical protein